MIRYVFFAEPAEDFAVWCVLEAVFAYGGHVCEGDALSRHLPEVESAAFDVDAVCAEPVCHEEVAAEFFGIVAWYEFVVPEVAVDPEWAVVL